MREATGTRNGTKTKLSAGGRGAGRGLRLWAAVGCMAAAASCQNGQGADGKNPSNASGRGEGKAQMAQKSDFGKTKDGTAVEAYTLTNANGVTAKVITYGATLTELHVPGKDGKAADVVLGFSSMNEKDGYQDPKDPYFGATVGRYGNRIAKGKFTLDGKEYTLATNNGPNALHGGPQGLRQGGLEGRARSGRRRRGRPLHLHQRRRRGGLPRHPQGVGHLHPDRQGRAGAGLQRHHRQGHGRQPDQPQLLQPGRRGQRRPS